MARSKIKTVLVAAFLVVSLAASGCSMRLPQTPGAGSGESPGSGEVAGSSLRPIANVPAQPPLDAPRSYGSDIAFQGDHAFAGNYGGVTIYDISSPDDPKVVSALACPGEQNDVSVKGNLMFLSVEEPRSGEDCESDRARSQDDWRGIRIFDISDKANPKYVSGVETHCGSHTHTLVPGKDGDNTLYIYVSSLNFGPESDTCRPPHGQISVVKVPLDDPESAEVVDEPRFFDAQEITGGRLSSGCHDITVLPEKDIAAGACMGEGLLLDISDRASPEIIQRVKDEENFDFWHSATFSNDASKVVFTDELGGGQLATCNEKVGPEKGADGIYELSGEGEEAKLEFRDYFKIPRAQEQNENCVAHNGSLVPVPGRDIMVQAWYQGGVSVIDFTDPENAKEIAYFDRGPLTSGEPMGGSWSAYWYNGHIYSSDMTKGLDVLDLEGPIGDAAKKAPKLEELNVQTQYPYPS